MSILNVSILRDLKKLIILIPLSLAIVPLTIATVALHLLGKFISVIITYPLRRTLGVLLPVYHNILGSEPLDIEKISENHNEQKS